MSDTGGARVSAALWRRPWLRASLTITPPLAWFLVIYLASLVAMLVTAFWTVNPFTNLNTVTTTTADPLVTAPAGTGGWIYNATTGNIWIDNATYYTQ